VAGFRFGGPRLRSEGLGLPFRVAGFPFGGPADLGRVSTLGAIPHLRVPS